MGRLLVFFFKNRCYLRLKFDLLCLRFTLRTSIAGSAKTHEVG